MAKKKVVIDVVDNGDGAHPLEVSQAVEPVYVGDEAPPPVELVGLPPVEVATKDHLLTVTAAEEFKDGALASRFAVLGYPLLWKKGETRSIPMTLLIRCKRSGARFEV